MFSPVSVVKKEVISDDFEVRLVLGTMTTAYTTETPPANTYQIVVDDRKANKVRSTFVSLTHYKEEYYKQAVEKLVQELKNERE